MHIEQYIIEVLIRDSNRENVLKQSYIVDEVLKLMKSEPTLPSGDTIKRRLYELADTECYSSKKEFTKKEYEELCSGRYEAKHGELLPGVYSVCSEKSRIGFWIENELSNEEMKYLLDSVLYSKILPHKKVEDFIKRIITNSSKDFRDSVKYFENMKKQIHMLDIDVLENLRVIQTAIKNHSRIEYVLNAYRWSYNPKKRKYEIRLEKCRENKYICSPYDIVFNSGRYYLIAGNVFQEKNGGYYYARLDLMTDIKELEEKAVTKEAAGVTFSQDLFKHRVQNQHIYSGEVDTVRLKVDTNICQQIVDSFGDEFTVERVKLSEEFIGEESIELTVTVNKESFIFWILQYGQHVEVLEPKEYRQTVADIVTAIANKYRKNEESQ